MVAFNLPDITFAERDPAIIEKSIITIFEAALGRTLAQGDPVRLILLSIISLIVQQRVLIDNSAKQNLLAFAKDDMLDHLGTRVKTLRLETQKASTTFRLKLSTALPSVHTIPSGIRVTPGNNIIFELSQPVEFAIGVTEAFGQGKCTIEGTAGNGYLPGQINQIIDPLPWLVSIENVTVSDGGADEEDDEPYRLRIQQSPEKFSTAGPDGAYEYWTKTASQNIVDVSVDSPSDCVVEIRPLMKQGALPTQEVLDAVFKTLSDRTIRPLTDKVSVLAPEITQYQVDLVYYIDREKATMSTTIQQAVQKAIDDYILWQKSKLGRDINPSELVFYVRGAGAKRVEILSPLFKKVEKYKVAICTSANVKFGGIEDD